MALKIRWTENALEDYKTVVSYLSQEWPPDIVLRFIDTVESRLEILSLFPNIGIASSHKKIIRAITITDHNKLYYRITDTAIEVIALFDTRQDPTKNKYK